MSQLIWYRGQERFCWNCETIQVMTMRICTSDPADVCNVVCKVCDAAMGQAKIVKPEVALGRQRMKEVFNQPIEELLTDYRAVRICHRYSVFRPFWTVDQFFIWVHDEIGPRRQNFPKEES